MKRRTFCKAAVAIPSLIAWETHASLMMVSGNRAVAAESGGAVGHGYTATHYVTADAAGGGDGSISDPWTATEAFASATAGNIVEFAPGVYPAPATNAGFYFANSGTSGSPIVFCAKYPAVHNLSDDSLWSQITAADRHCISNDRTGTGNEEYIVVDGFRTYQNTGNDFDGSGHHIFLHNDTGGTSNWKLRRILFDQENLADPGTVAALGGDNYGAIWTQGCSAIEITDCKFMRFVGTSHNQTCWTSYSIEDCVFKNCETDDIASGPYVKGNATSPDNRPILIHHNILKNCRGVQIEPNIIGNVAGSEYCDIFQNYFIAESGYNLGVRSSGSPSSDYPQYTRVVNNTFIGKTGSELLGHGDGLSSIWLWGSLTSADAQGTNCYFRNNIVQSSDTPNGVHRGSSAGDDTGAARPDSDYNLFGSNFENQFGSSGDQSKATWTSASSREGNSEFGTATFVDSDNEDYTLSGGSDGEDLGVDILNLLGGGTSAAINAGADIGNGAAIGIRSAATINAESFNWTYPFAS